MFIFPILFKIHRSLPKEPFMSYLQNSKTVFLCISIVLLICFFSCFAIPGHAAQNTAVKKRFESALTKSLAFGTPVKEIETFDGWTMWMGWDGSFSETYDPMSEVYAWVVYFSPQGLFVALQQAKANYSSVDMYAGFDYFYGTLKSPDGNVLRKSYLNSLMGVSLSIDAFDTSMLPAGPLSQVSIAVSSTQTLFRIGSLKTLQRGVQYGAGISTSFALLPFSLPFGVSLDFESEVTAGFYPIILWDIEPDSSQNPVDQVLSQLQVMSSSTDKSFPGFYEKEIADMMIPFMQTLPASSDMREFIDRDSGTSGIDSMIREVEQWLSSGDTSKLPGAIDPPLPPSAQYETMRPVKAITDACFELGYEHGYRATGRDDTIYADCIVTVNCSPGEQCTLTVTDDEIAALVPGAQPEDFDWADIGFDIPPENFLMGEEDVYWTYIEEGVATYSFTSNLDSPFILGVQVWPSSATGDKTIELCRRKVEFEETFTVPDVDYGAIEYDNSTQGCPSTSILGNDADGIATLRALRDQVLITSSYGRSFTAWYYKNSPLITSLLDRYPAFRAAAKSALQALIPAIDLIIVR